MKALACLSVAVAALVVSLAPSAGASSTTGKVVLVNLSDVEVGVSVEGDPDFHYLTPGRRFTYKGVLKLTNYQYDFDIDGDTVTDKSLFLDLGYTNKATIVVGDVGVYD